MNVVSIALVLFSLGFGALSAHGARLRSECDKPIYFAKLWSTGGGHDGLNGPGSWSKVHTKGWYRIGPYKDATIDTGYIMITVNNIPAHASDPKNPAVTYGCVDFSQPNGFAFNLADHDNTGKLGKVNPAGSCLSRGGKWWPFIKIDKNQTINFKNCNPSMPDPKKIRVKWQYNKGVFVRESKNNWVWYHETYDTRRPLYEEKQDANWVVMKRSSGVRNIYALGNNEVQRKDAGSSQWKQFATGKWDF